MASDLLGPLRRYLQLEPSSTPLRGLSILTYRSSGSNAPTQLAFSGTLTPVVDYFACERVWQGTVGWLDFGGKLGSIGRYDRMGKICLSGRMNTFQ